MSPHPRVFAAFLLFAVQCHATSIAVVITNNNIVVASDSKKYWFPGHGSEGDKDPTNKVVVINDRFVVGINGLAKGNGGWDALNLLQRVKDYLPANASISVIESVIIDKINPFMNRFSAYVANASRQDQLSFGDGIVQFIIVGYEDNVPVINTVRVDCDWNIRKVTSPTIHSVYPSQQNPIHVGFDMLSFGVSSAFAAVMGNPHGPEGQAMARLTGLAKTFASSGSKLTVAQAIATAADLVRLEAEFNPEHVGPPIDLIVLSRKDGPVLKFFPK
jgi:hypothetical protein